MENKDGFSFKRVKDSNKKPTNRNNLNNNDNPLQNNLNDLEFTFKIVKKRNTLIVNEDIDLTTEYENGEERNQIIPERINNTANFNELIDSYSSDKTIKIVVPEIKRVQSHELHTMVSDGNINSLIKECIKFLQVDTEFSKQLLKCCDLNMFTDINYKSEIARVKKETEEIKEEIQKWKNIAEEVRKENLDCDFTDDVISDNFEEDKFKILQVNLEIQEKFAKFDQITEDLNYELYKASVKVDSLLRKIFGVTDKGEVDGMFLLKALAKIGK